MCTRGNGSIEVRPARLEDTDAMGQVHVRAWRAAYRRHLPTGYRDGLDHVERAALWARAIRRTDPRCAVIVAVMEGAVVGFVSVSPTALSGLGELQALNVDPPYWGRGAGRKLIAAAEERLRTNFIEAELWVLPSNARARAIYEHNGWIEDGTERTMDVLGVTVTELRYHRILSRPSHTEQLQQ